MSSFFNNGAGKMNEIYVFRRKGDSADPFLNITESSKVPSTQKVVLKEIPNKFDKVQVKDSSNVGLFEVTTQVNMQTNQFYVDYTLGVVYFHSSQIGKTFSFVYMGTGVISLSASRIWIEDDGIQPTKFLQDLVNENKEGVISVQEVITSANTAIENAETATANTVQAINNAQNVADENKTRWLTPVVNYINIATAYPNPLHGDTVQVTSEGKVYRFVTGQGWKFKEEYNETVINNINQQLADTKTKVDGIDRGYGGTYASLSALQAAFPSGNDKRYVVSGNVKEVDTLTITAAPAASGNVTVTLNGVATNIAVTAGVAEVASLTVSAVPTAAGNVTVTLNGVAVNVVLDPATDTTVDAVAAKIRSTAFSGWTTGGTGAVVTFIANTAGVKTDTAYSAGSTGATGTISTTTQGVDADTATSVAAKIRAASFSGWTTGGTGTTVTFTKTTAGTNTAPAYSAGSTGATGNISVTTAGVAPDGNWYYWSGSSWTVGGVFQATGIGEGSVTPSTVAESTYTEILRRDDVQSLTKIKHGQLLNKFAGNKDGSRSLTSDVVDSCTVSFVNSDETIPYPVEKVTKVQRLSYTNKSSLYWYKKFAVSDVNSPEISGVWVKKTDLLKFTNLYNLIWFHDSAGASILLINPYITTAQAVVGYKKTTVNNGITVTLEVKEQYNDWLYIVQTANKKPANAATIGMGIFVSAGAGNITDKIDLVGCTQIEGKTEIMPFLLYPESSNEKFKTDAEISKNLTELQALVNPAPAAKVYNTVNFGYNLDGLSLLKFRSVLSKRAFQQVTIAVIGDSISEGFWSGLNWDRAYPVQLRKLMQAKYGGQDEGFVTVYTDDQRWTQTGTGWTKVGYKGLGAAQRSSATSGDKLTFTFKGVGVDIIHSKNTDGGSCVVKIDGVDMTPLNCYATAEVFAQKQSYDGLTSGDHVLEIYAPTDGKKVYVEGAYVKTVGDTKGIRVDRRARSGSYTGDWTSTLMLNTFTTQPADLFIIALGINDLGSNQTIAQFKSRLQTIITKAKSVGSVIIVPMMQADSVADTRFANWKDWVKVYYELADENNVGLIDVYKLYGEAYQPAQQYGLFGINGGNGEGTDTIHPSARGHQMIADAIFKLIG